VREIFVFGSNLAGRHGKGAALHAKEKHGAIYGQGVGLQGNSYGIPTKGNQKYPERLKTLNLSEIEAYVKDFIRFAHDHQGMQFNVTAIGCGLAGFTPEQIAPMFLYSPGNVVLPDSFVKVLTKE
jgi:hypothetical protein